MPEKPRQRPRHSRPVFGQVLVHVPLSAVVLVGLWRGVRRVMGALLSRLGPVLAFGLVVAVAWSLATAAPRFLVPALGLLGAGAVAWRFVHPPSFRQWLAWPCLAFWRRQRLYRPAWDSAMAACGLRTKFDANVHVPTLVRVRSTGAADQLTIRMLPGQVLDDYARVADRLAQTFGAMDARVRSEAEQPNHAVLWLLRRDPLAHPVAPLAPGAAPDLTAVPIALREDGLLYRLRLLGSHLLLVGATGSGKSSVIWSLVHALTPGIAAGTVSFWVIDPKGGMELIGGQPLFERFCDGDPGVADDRAAHEHAYADVLDDAVLLMRSRQARLRGTSRLHQPSPDDPLVVLVIDELASLTAYAIDRDAKKRISANLSLLLSQGRAVGVLVVAALQDPRKEVLPARDLFPTRVALRLTDADQVDLVLGDGAHDRGARCERIAESLPGVGYVAVDGVAEPVRVRFPYLTDDDIAELCEEYAPSVGSPRALESPGGEAA